MRVLRFFSQLFDQVELLLVIALFQAGKIGLRVNQTLHLGRQALKLAFGMVLDFCERRKG